MDCKKTLSHLSSDESALAVVKKGHKEDGFKFSSTCLDILLRKSFKEAAEYLQANYYPTTNIDTEVIVRKVTQDIQK